MGRHAGESAEAWYARAVHLLRVARTDEDGQWSRVREGGPLAENWRVPILDHAYLSAVERADHAQREVFEAAKARNIEQPL